MNKNENVLTICFNTFFNFVLTILLVSVFLICTEEDEKSWYFSKKKVRV